MDDRSDSRARRFFFSSLLALSLSACGHQPSASFCPRPAAPAQAYADVRAAALPALVEAAASGEVTSTAQLRLLGPPGLSALLAAYDATPTAHLERRAR